jgi:hypothetical protein
MMNIIEMAKEAGAIKRYWGEGKEGFAFQSDEQLEAFAALVREERDSMWLAQMEFEQKRVRAEVEAEWIETNKALAKEIIEQRNRYLDMLAEAVDLSVKAEREACAKVCDVIGADMSHPYVANNCAAAIRARGEK